MFSYYVEQQQELLQLFTNIMSYFDSFVVPFLFSYRFLGSWHYLITVQHLSDPRIGSHFYHFLYI